MVVAIYGVLLIFPALLLVAALADMLTMTIPNRLCLVMLVAFPPAALTAGMPLTDIGWHTVSGLGVLMVGIVFFALGGIGGGDAKMAAVIALWFGPSHLLDWGLLFTICGGLLTIVLLALRRFPLPVGAAGQPWIVRLHDRRTGVPYGIALAAAGLVVYPETSMVAGLLGL